MKKLILPALLGLAALASIPAHAATASDSFTVNVTFNSTCLVTQTANAALVRDDGPTPSTSTATPAGLNVWCTNNLPYTVALDNGDSMTRTNNVYTYTDATAKTTYTLTVGATGLNTTTLGNTGIGADQAYTITPAFVSTTCTAASCTNTATRTVTVTY
jgi:hypothetical protein